MSDVYLYEVTIFVFPSLWNYRPTSTDDAKSAENLPSSSQSQEVPKPSESSSETAGNPRPAPSNQNEPADSSSSSSGEESGHVSSSKVECIAILPGIGTYSNSSGDDSDSDSSDSDGGIELIKTVFHNGKRKHGCEKWYRFYFAKHLWSVACMYLQC